jgi:hypothetical protein
MSYGIRRVDYFYVTVQGRSAEAFGFLDQLAGLGINMLAFNGMPLGPEKTQLTIFPEDSSSFTDAARKAGLTLDGPKVALLVQGDDERGAMAKVHHDLHDVGVDVYASTGISDGRGGFGAVLYIRAEEYARAAKALGLR